MPKCLKLPSSLYKNAGLAPWMTTNTIKNKAIATDVLFLLIKALDIYNKLYLDYYIYIQTTQLLFVFLTIHIQLKTPNIKRTIHLNEMEHHIRVS
jgi:hypothetical protein